MSPGSLFSFRVFEPQQDSEGEDGIGEKSCRPLREDRKEMDSLLGNRKEVNSLEEGKKEMVCTTKAGLAG